MGTIRRTTRRPPALRLEELSRRDVWSVSALSATATVYDVSFTLQVTPDNTVWRAVTFVTPDGESYAGSLTQQGAQLTGRLDHDFTVTASSVLLVRVTETTPTYERYREISLELTPQPGAPPLATDGLIGANDGTGLSMNQFPVPLDTGLGAVSVLSNRPLQLTPGEMHFGITNDPITLSPPPAPPVVTGPPPVPVVPPPPAVQPPPNGAQQVPPPASETPSVVPPTPTPPPPPRRPDTPITPALLVSSQLDHVAGAFLTPSGASSDLLASTPIDRVALESSARRVADRVAIVPWATSYSPFAGAAIADFDARERVRTIDRSTPTVAASGLVRTASHTLPVAANENVPPAADATSEVEVVVVGTDQTRADAVLMRLAARPLPTADPPREKRPSRLFGAFSVLVMSGLGLRWFRSRPAKRPGESPGDEWVPPLL